jgi:bifunctional UDP-N-acetylglucosamine pyrophosphorylase/glucosamine-1-phosphate N-acetyltransferase
MMLNFIILGAGKGTRMLSSTPKVMHKIVGKHMIEIVLDVAKNFNPKQIIGVLSEENYEDAKKLGFNNIVIQKERLGTGHAVLQALSSLNDEGKTFILYGDTPLIKKETLENMQNQLADVVVLGFEGEREEKYGRLVTTGEEVERIVEFKDLTPKEENIILFNSGVFLVKTDVLKSLVPQISNSNNSKEYYLTDIVAIAKEKGLKTKFILCPKEDVLGVNNRAELAKCEEVMQNRLRQMHLLNGVTLIDPSSVFFHFDTKIESDVLIEPNVFFGANCQISSGCHIKAFSYLEGCKLERGVSVGPFARIRGETTIGENSKIGNFVEVKNSTLKNEVKAGHLAYIGDAEVGEEVNIGAGAVFCNYDGVKKHKTIIEKKAFVGSNTSLIAPITIGESAVLGAGSVITEDVKAEALAIERSTQNIVLNYKKKT